MPQDRFAPGSVDEWLSRARGDLALAKVPLPSGGFYEDLCYHAQQATEKALKAVYVRYGWAFRYVHDLLELMGGLEANGLTVPTEVRRAAALSTYAHATRYPGVGESVTVEDHGEAVRLATLVVEWAESITR